MKTGRMFRAVCALVVVWPLGLLAQARVDNTPYGIEDFIRKDRFQSVKISPKGTYAAATVPIDDKTVLVVLKPGQTKPYGTFNLRGKTHVSSFQWVNDNRLLFTVGEKNGALEQPSAQGEIWGMNADGSRAGVLVGWKNVDSTSSRAGGNARKEAVAADLVDGLEGDDDKAIISVYRLGTAYTSAERMDVTSGARVAVAQAPVERASFTTDNNGEVRFAAGAKNDNNNKLYYRKAGSSSWTLINDESSSGRVVSALDFNADNSIAYLLSEEKTGPSSVLAFNVASEQTSTVARDPNADPAGLLYAVGSSKPIGVMFQAPKPKYTYFDPASAEARLHRSLQSSFGGDAVFTGSNTLDGKQALLFVTSDRNPGDYYVFDTQSKNADLLISRKSWLDPRRLGETRAVEFSARDGRKIHGLLTLPPGSDGRGLPLVVNPHGGPFGVQDTWTYEDERQLLASHGYAVLQVNFRGSAGYGREHLRAGYKQWGRAMQDDVTDATRWAIQQQIADANRICIYGASYGGYASLMGVAKEPSLYKCAVGYVGVYDLHMLQRRGDMSQRMSSVNFLKDAVGTEGLNEASPNKLAANIRVPVFLAAGGEDVRAPQDHSEAMEKALKAAGVPVETLYYSTEGHGFYKEEHQREFYTRLLSFLHKYIGGKAPLTASAAR